MTKDCIAIVDDEGQVRSALGRLLRLADFEVLSFESGQALIDSLAQRVPDCVLLDVQMPGLSGLQVHAQLRVSHPLLQVIFITASDDAEVIQRASDAGASALLRKPFTNRAMLEAVHSALPSHPGAAMGLRRGAGAN